MLRYKSVLKDDVTVVVPLESLLTMTIILMVAALTIAIEGGPSSYIPQVEEAYAFGNQIIQNEQQYNLDCMSAITCFNGPIPAYFPYTNIADVAFSDFALVNQNTFQLNEMCPNSSCINVATNYD